MKEYAREFYQSAAWKRARQQAIKNANGLCERCIRTGIYRAGAIVHHRIHITPKNINNPYITLDVNNLEYVCEDCHNKEHSTKQHKRYGFDQNGNLTPPAPATPPGTGKFSGKKRTGGERSKKRYGGAHI